MPIHLSQPDEARALLEFARTSATRGGFAWLWDDGTPDPTKQVHLWITARMTHAFSLGHLLGVSGSGDLATHGITALAGPLRDPDGRGWVSSIPFGAQRASVSSMFGPPKSGPSFPFAALPPDVGASSAPKLAYDHAFVVLAASSAVTAGIADAEDLLDTALESMEILWWDETHGTVVDERGRDGVVDPYRGANANMHTVEALLAAAAAGADSLWLGRAMRIAERFAGEFEAHGLRLPEHYDTSWRPLLDYNLEVPADPFRPYGATPGHAFEWARLMVTLAGELRRRRMDVPAAFTSLPARLYARARADAWAADGADGFVYTTDFDGRPVVRQRMHWVLCEAIGAAAVLRTVALNGEVGDAVDDDGGLRSADRGTGAAGDPAAYASDIEQYWDYAERHLIERPGAWRHELNPDNSPAAGTWAGKPDIYHALQACLVGDLPVSASFAESLAGTL